MKIETPNVPHRSVSETQEGKRLAHAENGESWRQWGPYLSERQWGTVREDYSADGDAWAYFPHDHARSRAYRWGEDGIGGVCDDKQQLCLSLALWNGRDPILKERFFGLTNAEGNHGEDVKELYYYLDGTPTHSYMRMLYKYPQNAFPYADLVETNAKRAATEPEYNLIDTGIFDQNRYFDVTIEHAKASTDDILMLVTVTNRGPERATLHLVPQIFARNSWSWEAGVPKPRLEVDHVGHIRIDHPGLPPMRLTADGKPELLFCENETNERRLYDQKVAGYFKDGINDRIVGRNRTAVNPEQRGTKAALHYVFDIEAGGSITIRLRLRREEIRHPPQSFEEVMALRRAEADEFYDALQQSMTDADARLVQRQALAGLLWSKQFYCFDVRRWLQGDTTEPAPPESHRHRRNANWPHLALADVISMPDTWEYPWFAAWDLAFHCVAFALIDPGFAKSQLVLLTQARALHPSGQLPAYEWSFDDVDPPVHAWAALQIYEIDRQRSGVGDTVFLERVFHKLIMNFTWWVNREDADGHNIFQGGFLGLDNISVFDRSAVLADGCHVDQSDGTAWVAMFSLNMMRIALELAVQNHVYEDLATKFFEHFLYISEAVHSLGGGTGTGLWDDGDGFYYDVLQTPGQQGEPLRVRSLVGLIPILAVEVLHDSFLTKLPQFRERLQWFLDHRRDLADLVSHWTDENRLEFRLLALMRRDRMTRVMKRMLDEDEFLSDFGLRSLSKFHLAHPFTLNRREGPLQVGYQPGEATVRIYGGNSNWRGPVWMPLNYLIIEALQKFHKFYGDEFRIEYPTNSGAFLTLQEVAESLGQRLQKLFLKDGDGRRTYLADSALQQDDPHFRDKLLFHEYFHGDTGEGLGASHQTGWTALIALLLHPREEIDPSHVTPATATTENSAPPEGKSP